jgi:hypothetical protein
VWFARHSGDTFTLGMQIEGEQEKRRGGEQEVAV